MTELRIPPDGLIAKHFADAAEGLKPDSRRYMRACLLRGMRDEPLPHPERGAKLTAMDAVFVRDRVRDLLPRIALIREGEQPLPASQRQQAEAQETLPF